MGEKTIERAYYNPVVERMSREELLAYQWRKLKAQIEYLYRNNPFYRHKFQELKITPDDIKTMEDFRNKLPLLGKKDWLKDQDEAPPYGTRLGVPLNKLVHVFTTSGTSGMGQETYGITRADWEFGGEWARGFYWAGLRAGDVAISTMPNTLSTLNGPDSLAMSFIKLRANYIPLDVTISWERKAQYMKRFSPHFIFMVDVFRMNKVFEELGMDPKRDLPRLKCLYLALAGAWTIDTILRVENHWGVKCYNMYGITQGRTSIAHACENGMVHNGKYGMFHMSEDHTLFEVLDRETREPVKPGEEGELVITNLISEASPALRFATNDRVIYAPHNYCDCGRPFAGIQVGSIHRYDDMMKLRGINVWPEAVDMIVFGYDEIAEYLGRVWVDQKGLEQITLTLEFKKGISDERKKELLAQVPRRTREETGIRMDPVEADKTLPRWEFKSRRWTDERIKGLHRIAY